MPAESVAAVVEECGRKQVYGVVILSAGFSELGAEGAALEADVLRVARSWGVRVVGPNCLGIINTDPDVRLHATFANVVPRRGRVSLLSESGMVGAAIIGQARERGIGISSFVALGNRADVSSNDLLQYWTSDESTDVVCMYIESLGNPRHFSRLARRLSRAKPVVTVKAGRLPTSMASVGRDETEAALLEQTGVIHVPTLAAMLDTARLLTSQPLPPGRRVAIVGNAGGSLAIAADAVVEAGLLLSELAPGTQEALSELATHSVGALGVVDLGLKAQRRRHRARGRITGRRPRRRQRARASTPRRSARPPAEAEAALEVGRQARPAVPVVACFYGPVPAAAGPGPVPVFDAVEAAARALGRAAAYAGWLALEEGEAEPLSEASVARGPQPRAGPPASRRRARRSTSPPPWPCSMPSDWSPCPPRWCARSTRPFGRRRRWAIPWC